MCKWLWVQIPRIAKWFVSFYCVEMCVRYDAHKLSTHPSICIVISNGFWTHCSLLCLCAFPFAWVWIPIFAPFCMCEHSTQNSHSELISNTHLLNCHISQPATFGNVQKLLPIIVKCHFDLSIFRSTRAHGRSSPCVCVAVSLVLHLHRFNIEFSVYGLMVERCVHGGFGWK